MRVPRGIGLVFMVAVAAALVAGLILTIVLVSRKSNDPAGNFAFFHEACFISISEEKLRVITLAVCNSESEQPTSLRAKRDTTTPACDLSKVSVHATILITLLV